MRFVADLHIHSHYSLSTSRELTPPRLESWARRKGILVVGTGDATHPGWLKELQSCLEPAEEGLFLLRQDLREAAPGAPASTPRFLLSAEVSTIYRRGERTRKVHHLILLPGLAAAEALQRRLERVGSLVSDGRPVLGLDARLLLEMVLESCPGAFFIPAHIWTPWFSALGDKSGFDSIEECYGELASEIYAVETGLSSDPPMNWACSFLDRFALVSNSDAHSPEKLGREANLFDCGLSYPSLIAALKAAATAGGGAAGPDAFLGTLEFFPQEGKYHYDGHRKCGVRWEPRQTLEKGGLCPVCGKPVTVGVLNRVAQLANRALETPAPPPGRAGFHSLIPLKEILAEILGTGAQSRQVSRRYDEVLGRGVTELGLLLELPVPEVARLGGEALGEAVRRMRAGQVRVEPGYDGEYGLVRLFARGELHELGAQALLFAEAPGRARKSDGAAGAASAGRGGSRARADADLKAFRDIARRRRPAEARSGEASGTAASGGSPAAAAEASAGRGPAPLHRLNPEQIRAVEHGEGPALVLAGPGTGKTAVLTARIAHLIQARGAEPEGIAAVTFTNRAAREMRERLALLLPDPRVRERIRVGTFHAYGLALLKRHGARLDLNWPFTIVNQEEREELLAGLPACPKGRAAALAEAISLAKQVPAGEADIPPDAGELLAQYEATLAMHNAVDLDDLLRLPVRLLASQPEVLREARSRTPHLLIDEYQDVNAVQYRLVQLLMPAPDPPLFAIGDPHQAIYGFRGADSRFLGRFLEDYPGAAVYSLGTSYRCSATILQASAAVLFPEPSPLGPAPVRRAGRRPARLRISEHASQDSEAEYVARTIEGLMGGTRFFSLDSQITSGEQRSGIRSFADIAVLCRVARQMDPLAKALRDHAIPYQAASDAPWLRQEPARSMLRILQALRAPGNTLARDRVLQARLASAEDLQRWRQDFERDGDLAGLLRSLAAAFPEAEAAQSGLARLAADCGGGVDEFLELALLGAESDSLAREAERVSLLSLHAAKGLEFPCVFITGCEDGLLPYTLAARRPADPQEERRLFYVGLTRASAYLYLTHARRRFLFGREHRLPPSPFLAGLGEELAERLQPDPPAASRAPAAEQLDLF